MISSNVIIGFLLFIIIFNWLRSPKSSPTTGLSYPGMSTSQRMAAYEEIWRKEENDLWTWLEQRVGMQEILYPGGTGDQELIAQARKQREQSLKAKGVRKAVSDVKMSEREVDQAIRITEERLAVLKRAVEEGKTLKEGPKAPAKDEGEGEKEGEPPPKNERADAETVR